jgi:hypothetical protein
MPDYLIFENWPVSMRLWDLRKKSDRITTASSKKADEMTEVELSIMSIIDVLLDELEKLHNASS